MNRIPRIQMKAAGLVCLLITSVALSACPRPDEPASDGARGDLHDASAAPDTPRLPDAPGPPDKGLDVAVSDLNPVLDTVPDASPKPDAPAPDASKPDVGKPDVGKPDSAVPSKEVCDGKDNDHDGKVDEDTEQPCYTGPAGTKGVGICISGVRYCNGGTYSKKCLGEVTPAAKEYCGDTQDNDCDGKTDYLDTDCPAPCVPTILPVHKMVGAIKDKAVGASVPTNHKVTCTTGQHTNSSGKKVTHLNMTFTNYEDAWVICRSDPALTPVDMTPFERDEVALVITLKVNSAKVHGQINFWYMDAGATCEKYVVLALPGKTNALGLGYHELAFFKSDAKKRKWPAKCDTGSSTADGGVADGGASSLLKTARVQIVNEWTNHSKYWTPPVSYVDPVIGDIDLLSVKLVPKSCLCQKHSDCHPATQFCCPVDFKPVKKNVCKSNCALPW